jgi:hypothetical protein
MLYSEIIAVCSDIYTKHINTLCGQNVLRSKHTFYGESLLACVFILLAVTVQCFQQSCD